MGGAALSLVAGAVRLGEASRSSGAGWQGGSSSSAVSSFLGPATGGQGEGPPQGLEAARTGEAFWDPSSPKPLAGPRASGMGGAPRLPPLPLGQAYLGPCKMKEGWKRS